MRGTSGKSTIPSGNDLGTVQTILDQHLCDAEYRVAQLRAIRNTLNNMTIPSAHEFVRETVGGRPTPGGLSAQKVVRGYKMCSSCWTPKPATTEFFHPCYSKSALKIMRSGFYSKCKACN